MILTDTRLPRTPETTILRAVPRLLSTALVFALLTGTAAAFALTEGLKLEKTPVLGTQVAKVFSPTCGCRTSSARIFFRLRKAESLRVTIEHDGDEVRTLTSRTYRRGPIQLFWDGRDDAGRVQPDGRYIPVVHLGRSHRTIRLPNPIRLDTRLPLVTSAAVRPGVFSPDGDGRADRIVVRYRFDEPAHPALFVNGKQRVIGRFQRPVGQLDWFGKVRGRSLRPGTYEIAIAARDVAGNLGRPRVVGIVQVRYLALGRDTVRVVAGARFSLRVSADARTVRWRLAGRTGTAPRGTMKLRAPRAPGRYILFVFANGHGARATVVVRPRP